MGCSGCGKRRTQRSAKDLMARAKYMNDRQLKARLEVYKRENCRNCEKKDKCDYEVYVACKGANG